VRLPPRNAPGWRPTISPMKANDDSVEEEDAEEVNDSAADEVSPLCPCIVYNTHNFIQCLRGLERSPSATWNWTPATKLRRSNMM